MLQSGPFIELFQLYTGAFIVIAAVFFLSGVVKGGMSFGQPLVTISILPLLVPADLVLAINAMILPFTNIYQFWLAGEMGKSLKRFWPLMLGLIIATPLAAWFAASIDGRLLLGLIGILVVVFILLTIFNPALHIREAVEKPWGFITGIVGGISGALSTAAGPVFLVYLLGLHADRQTLMSSNGLFMIVIGFTMWISYWQVGWINQPRILLAVLLLGFVSLGMWVGNRLAGLLSANGFRNLVLGVVLLLGCNMVYRAFG